MYEMINQESKYEKVIGLLRKSTPEPGNQEILTETIIAKLINEKRQTFPELIFEYVFGWIYVDSVRKSLAGAAFFILIFFGFQQIIIMRRINELSDKMIITGNQYFPVGNYSFSGTLLLHLISNGQIKSGDIVINEKDIDQIVESYSALQVKYKIIFDQIEKDPQLKKYLMDKLSEHQKLRLN
jgi:hypothetical protein